MSLREIHAARNRRGRPRKDLVTSVMCRLRAPHFKDEMSRILGDAELPYRGIFGDDKIAADTSRTAPNAEDRALVSQFHNALLTPEANVHAPDLSTSVSQTMGSTPCLSVHYGRKYAMDAWYRSAYPTEYTLREYMSVCCYCLDYQTSDLMAERHSLKCRGKLPPGREIYRDGKLSIWEVDGSHAGLYCQNLCLLAKLFLSSKALYKDVQPFFFYVLTEEDGAGAARFVGYFSKQKMCSVFKPKDPIQCVSCIMTLPCTQKSGYGQYLIDFSYHLARQQDAVGGPETPLSMLGEKAFRIYWRRSVCYAVNDNLKNKTPFSVGSLSKETGIHVNHIVLALEDLGWLKPESDEGQFKLVIDKSHLAAIIAKWDNFRNLTLKPEKLMWAPLYE